MASRWKRYEEKVEMTKPPPPAVPHVKKRMKSIRPSPQDTKKENSNCSIFISALESRYIGLLIGPLFGIFLYYYITFLILNGPPFTKEIVTTSFENLDGAGIRNNEHLEYKSSTEKRGKLWFRNKDNKKQEIDPDLKLSQTSSKKMDEAVLFDNTIR